MLKSLEGETQNSEKKKMMQDKLQIDSAAVSDKGLSEKRPQNEDSYLELRDSGLYAVADGVGGAAAGDVASQMAMEILGEAFINLQENGDAEQRMQSAIEQANSAIFQTSNELAQLSTMATTIVAVHINGNVATIGHVGDSRLYRLDENGNLLRETQDHSVVEEEVRAGRMTPEQALTHPSRNVISRALGAEQNVEIDMKTIMFEPNTKFLVCSDGVTRHIPDVELRSLLSSENDSSLICRKIKELCYERGAEDNLTAVIIAIGKAVEENFAFENFPASSESFEEDTIATPRPPLVNSAVFSNSPAKKEFVQESDFLNETDSESTFQENDVNSDTVEQQNTADESVNYHAAENDTVEILQSSNDGEPTKSENIRASQTVNQSNSGGLGKLISSLLWFAVGLTIGALGYYFFVSMNAADGDAQKTPMASAALMTFEQKRRLVDASPEAYIANNPNSKDASDNYLLGRAFRLTGNFDSAKKELEKAKADVDSIDIANRRVVENDINLELDKIDSGNNTTVIPSSNGNDSPVNPPATGEPLVEPSN